MTTNLIDVFDLATQEEVAELRGVKLPHLRNERSLGKGPTYVKLGNKILYPRKELRKFIDRNTVTPKTATTLADSRKRGRA
jgi:hypothetical protein